MSIINLEIQTLEAGTDFSEDKPQLQPDYNGSIAIFSGRSKGGYFNELNTSRYFYNLSQISFDFKSASSWTIKVHKNYHSNDIEILNETQHGSNSGIVQFDELFTPTGNGDAIKISTSGVGSNEKPWAEVLGFVKS